ncbi:hypothetical protein [Lacrimispora sp.]|uniref:hypothetical protein n=1 Tax=Lacrimispora sp. TaxID=2719234 RepID=UPI0032E4F235
MIGYEMALKKILDYSTQILNQLFDKKMERFFEERKIRKIFTKLDNNIINKINSNFRDTYLEDRLKNFIMSDETIISTNFKFISDDDRDSFIDLFIKTYPDVKVLPNIDKSLIFECLNEYLTMLNDAVVNMVSTEGKIVLAQTKKTEKKILDNAETNKGFVVNKILETEENILKKIDDSNKVACDNELSIINDLLEDAEKLFAIGSFEESLKKYDNILEKISSKRYPEMFCKIKLKMGTIYGKRAVRDNKKMNCLKALESLKKVIEVGDNLLEDRLISAAYNDMGNCYCMLGEISEKSINDTLAIECYEKALIYTNAITNEKDFIHTKINIASAYRALSLVENSEVNIKKSIEIFASIEKNIDEKNFLYANLQNNIGISYNTAYKYTYDKEYLIKSNEAYFKSLKFYRIDKFADEYSKITSNISANYYSLSHEYEKISNIKKAIKYCEEALLIRSVEDYPQDYAHSNWLMGTYYNELLLVQRDIDFATKAIKAFDNSSRIFRIDKYPTEFGNIQFGYGNTYRNLAILEKSVESAIKAKEYYKRALKFNNIQDNPIDFNTISQQIKTIEELIDLLTTINISI